MEKLDYHELVKKVIQQHASEKVEADANKAQIVFDTERDRCSYWWYIAPVQVSLIHVIAVRCDHLL
jgi:hypothetical protein